MEKNGYRDIVKGKRSQKNREALILSGERRAEYQTEITPIYSRLVLGQKVWKLGIE